jgi:hypothetical protein
MTELERWLFLADCIGRLIGTVEKEIGEKNFAGVNDRHSLSKINKKLYEALEVASKAADTLRKE